MLNTLAENLNTTDKFQNAEQLWFWFLYSKSMQNNVGYRQHCSRLQRPCEVLDVEILITKLYLSGKLKDEHLITMKKFGDKKRAPLQYIYAENKAAALWDEAMQILGQATKEKGWTIE